MNNTRIYFSFAGYALLLYVFILMPFHLYTPTRFFDLPGPLWFTHLILLYLHEAGHLFFSLFGRTISILGGSLNQIFIPVIWYIVALREGSSLSSVALFFTGVSIVDVSIYVKDAAVLQLPLIGGLSKAHHDWRNLLRGWEMIDDAFILGEMLFWFGMMIAAMGLTVGIISSNRSYHGTTGKQG
ncbi:MAG: hypothetical protein WCX28_10470 [Bacteriovoracaceae bacterium]|nr:hypothetical protein [Bacteroidota bacterium]